MADTGKDKGQVLKSWLVCLLAFFPVANCIPFFYMNSRTHRKKYVIFGWLVLILNIVLPVAILMALMSDNPNRLPGYSTVETAPDVEDYMNDDQKVKYWEDYSYINSAEFKLSEESEAYETAYDEYTARMMEWQAQPEYQAQYQAYRQWAVRRGLFTWLGMILFFIMDVLFLILAFIERPRCLRMQTQEANKASLRNRLQQAQSESLAQGAGQNRQEAGLKREEDAGISGDLPRETVSPAAGEEALAMLDINRASEEELASLPGLTIVDAKKAVAHRDQSGGFASVDEFFDCIQAKPHVIVRIQDRLMAGTVEEKKADVEKKPETKVKRRIEL